MKKLPIGIQNITEIICEDYLYIDKTALIYRLISEGKAYFLSRPRRFGKSLLISTLEAIFKGKKALFQGLAIAQHDWDWQSHPVIRIDFSNLPFGSPERLLYGLHNMIAEIANNYGVTITEKKELKLVLRELIIQLSQINRVVILIDEYDKPVIQHLGKDIEIAKQNRDILKEFYEVIKGCDEYLKFVFLTGISKFSKMSVFSGLNNLNDISMLPRYATLLGCTEQEIDQHFSEYVTDLAQEQGISISASREKMRQWYNGFRFSEKEITVYTPYSLLLLFNNCKFDNYWFSTATPSFLIALLNEQQYDLRNIEPKDVGRMTFSSYELDNLHVLPLLVQTGYLTISAYRPEDDDYDLSYPNFEVEESFTQCLLEMMTGIEPSQNSGYISRCVKYLKANKLDDFFANLQVFFANIPYHIQLPKEQYYQTVFFIIFKLIGLKIHAEMHTNAGRIDAVLETATHIYLIEFKLDGNAEQALQQIHDKRYYEKYLQHGKQIVLVGVNFSKQQRNMDDYQVDVLR